jgi:putative methionine-R-sulfoxide reductase with GAF domain
MMIANVPLTMDAEPLMSWAEMLVEDDVEVQSAKIATWLKKHHGVQGIALLIQDQRLDRPLLYSEANQIEESRKETRSADFTAGEGHLMNIHEHGESSEPVILSIPLATEDHPIGTLAVIGDSALMRSLPAENSPFCWLGPLISHLLDNSIVHEHKNRKIRMLNLYQAVSSSICYAGDLHELLTTIMTIVTDELLCEEGSVIFLDEDNNEFEFFTAVGATAMDLAKVRFPADKGIAGKTLKERTSQIVNDTQTCSDFYPVIDSLHDFKTESILAVPILSGAETVGVIEAINKLDHKDFDREDAQILAAIADEVALAVKNAKLFDYVVDSYCKIRQGQHSCSGCKRPLKSWTPCVRHLNLS